MSFKITGFDKLERKLNELQGQHEIPLTELFNSGFMVKYSDFSDFQEFANRSGFNWDDIGSIDDSALDIFISKNSTFNNWSDMKTKAAELWIVKKWNS